MLNEIFFNLYRNDKIVRVIFIQLLLSIGYFTGQLNAYLVTLLDKYD